MKKWMMAYNFLKFILKARHTKGYSVHSPFMFHIIRNIFGEKHPFYVFRDIENVRSELYKDQKKLFIQDFGTGTDRYEKVSTIARRSVKKKKYAQLLFRLVNYFKPAVVIELGTSLGVTTAYLASGYSGSKCLTFEGSPELADFARSLMNRLSISNVTVVDGNINETLEDHLNIHKTVDFVFIDANHTSDNVLLYFNTLLKYRNDNTIIIIDDIHWSKDMTSAWQAIKENEFVTSSIDVFEMGIVFFNTDLHKKHYRVRF